MLTSCSVVSELVSLVCRLSGTSGGVGEAGDAELDGCGAAGADLVHLDEFGVRAGEADLETLGLAVPAVGFGFSDAGEQVSRICSSRARAAGSGRSSGQRRQLCSWMQGVS